MPEFIENLLTGIRRWVNGKIADIDTAIDNKQDILTPGDNIEITSGGTINVTGITVPVASDFDIKDLADSDDLRSEWSAKQDALTPGDNIEITSGGTINVTGITGVIDAELEGLTLVISSNINELDGRLIDVENNKQDILTAGDNIEIDSAGTISCTITSTSQLDNDSDFIVGEELSYSEHALFYSGDDVVATGMVSRVGSVVTLYVAHADVVDGWRDIYYRLPYEPASSYISTVNSRGIYESDGIHYKVTFDYQTVGSVVYPVLRLNHYINGEIANWEYGQVVSFKVDYITSE